MLLLLFCIPVLLSLVGLIYQNEFHLFVETTEEKYPILFPLAVFGIALMLSKHIYLLVTDKESGWYEMIIAIGSASIGIACGVIAVSRIVAN